MISNSEDPVAGLSDVDAVAGYQEELDTGAVAQYLSDLSQPGLVPNGVAPEKEPQSFQSEDVSFQTNDWLLKTLSVQAWLCLDAPVIGAMPAEQLAESLFRQILPDGNERASTCYAVSEGGVVRLTETGMEVLERRLSRSAEYKSAYAEMIDDDRSPADASAEWRQLWEDIDGQAQQAVAIKASVETWRIKDLKDFAIERALDLNPTYQRDVVWSNSESQLLIDSILRGIPLPSVILREVEGNEAMQIVDGKQRLTAILRFIGQHPDATDYAKKLDPGLELFHANFRKFASKNQLKPVDIAAKFLPFKLGKYGPKDPLSRLSGKYYCEIKADRITIGGEPKTVATIFEKASSDYLVPVILYRKTTLRDIHQVFGLYNRQGKKLNAEELRNAIFHHLDLTRLLLVLSGDRPSFGQLAPYVPQDVRQNAENVWDALKGYGFGTFRFKRTKVLSWMCSVLLKAPRESGQGIPTTPSTAKHIDALLSEVKDGHRLAQHTTLVALARDLQAAVVLHHVEADDAWHPAFRTKKNSTGMASKWEELPLVASLIVCFFLSVSRKGELLREKAGIIRALTRGLVGPTSTQNKTQWTHIAKVVTRVLDALGLDQDELAALVTERYGHSCLATLRRLAGGETAP